MSLPPIPPGDCWGPGGPEWLFGAAIFGPILGGWLLMLWRIIIGARTGDFALGRRYPKIPAVAWQTLVVSGVALYVYVETQDFLDPMPERRLIATVLTALVLVFGGLLAVTSRRVVSFRTDDLRVLPRAVLFALPFLAALCVLTGEGAVAAMLVRGGPC